MFDGEYNLNIYANDDDNAGEGMDEKRRQCPIITDLEWFWWNIGRYEWQHFPVGGACKNSVSNPIKGDTSSRKLTRYLVRSEGRDGLVTHLQEKEHSANGHNST